MGGLLPLLCPFREVLLLWKELFLRLNSAKRTQGVWGHAPREVLLFYSAKK
jgi:hypothetical protein